MRRGVSRAEVAALRKRAPMADVNPIALIVRTIIHASSTSRDPPPRTAVQDALIAAAHVAFANSGKVQRLILDNMDPVGGRLLEMPRGPVHARG
jgi:hypothetical protein